MANTGKVCPEKVVWERLRRHTIGIGGLPKRLQGTRTRSNRDRREVAKQVCGSGVLVQWGKHQGIMTAGHCVEQIQKAMEQDLKFGHQIITGPGDFGNTSAFFPKVAGATYTVGEVVEVDEGTEVPWPDWGIIWLTRDQAQTVRDLTGKVFYGADAHEKGWGSENTRMELVAVSATHEETEERAFQHSGAVLKWGWLMPIDGIQILKAETIEAGAEGSRERPSVIRAVVADTTVAESIDEEADKVAGGATIPENDFGGTSGAGIWLVRGNGHECQDIKLIGVVTSHIPRRAADEQMNVLIGHAPNDIIRMAEQKGVIA